MMGNLGMRARSALLVVVAAACSADGLPYVADFARGQRRQR